jgi:ankyrin repeat protein
MQAEAGLPVAMSNAANEGDAQAMAAWLDEGGCVDARCSEHDGATLLMAAATGGQDSEAMVRMLLQRGAGVNLQVPNGGTALMGAAANGLTTIVQALLDAKADASLQTTDGRTALMYAERHKHAATAQLLRKHAKRQAAEAEARAAASMVHAAATADAMAVELLAEEAAEKEAATKNGKGKTKMARAPSTPNLTFGPNPDLNPNPNPISSRKPIALTQTLTLASTLTLALTPALALDLTLTLTLRSQR